MKKMTYILSSIFILLLLIGCGEYQPGGGECYDESLGYLENIENLKRSIKAGDTDKVKGTNISVATNYYNAANRYYKNLVLFNCKLIHGEKEIIEKRVELSKYKKILDAIPYKEIQPNTKYRANYKTVDYSGLEYRTLEYRVRYGDLSPYK